MSQQLHDRADMYADVQLWLTTHMGPAAFALTDDAVAHLADWLVAERGWTRHE